MAVIQAREPTTPLRKLRRKAGISLRKLSIETGITKGSLSRIERVGVQHQVPDPKTAERIADYFCHTQDKEPRQKRARRKLISELEILYPERYIKN